MKPKHINISFTNVDKGEEVSNLLKSLRFKTGLNYPEIVRIALHDYNHSLNKNTKI
jgi:hypothetical protein